MTFEEQLRRLEAVVEKLEQGDDDLDEVLRMFEEGTRLVHECTSRLTRVEARFEELQQQLDSATNGQQDRSESTKE